MNIVNTADRCCGVSITCGAISGVFCAARRLLDQAKKARPSTIPMTIMTGAGDNPSTPNGAVGSVSRIPPAINAVDANADQWDGESHQVEADPIDPPVAPASTGSNRLPRTKTQAARIASKPERVAPADPRAEGARDQKCHHATHGLRRAQPTEGLDLLPASVIGGDQHDQCRDPCGRRAGPRPGPDHHRRVRAQGQDRQRPAE